MPISKCPTCTSPDPKMHPAVQFGGEVELCGDSWHRPTKAEILAKELAQRPPASAQSEKWRELADELSEDLRANRSPAIGTLAKVMDALHQGATAAEACDQLQKDNDHYEVIIRTPWLEMEAQNAKLRELLTDVVNGCDTLTPKLKARIDAATKTEEP